MQRLLFLLMLAVVGGLGWMIVQGGGLSQIAVTSKTPQKSVAKDGAAASGPWGPLGTGPIGTGPIGTGPIGTGPIGTGPVVFDAHPQNSQQPRIQAARSQTLPAKKEGTLRIASFNIQVFGNNKASNLPVIRTLAEIIRQFDLIAIQEVRSKNEYLIPNFVKRINQPSRLAPAGRQYKHVMGPRLGYTSSKEQYAFIFDSQRVEMDPHSVYTVSDPDGLLHREPLVATFRARGVDPLKAFTFTLVNVHIDPDQVPEELDVLADVYRAVRRSSGGEDDILLLGDFNTDDRHLYRLGKVAGIYPLVVGTWTNTRQTKQYDNLIIHRPSTTEYLGRWGVFDVVRRWNLTEQQALQVSDHFPVWAEFSVYERDFSGRVASRTKKQW